MRIEIYEQLALECAEYAKNKTTDLISRESRDVILIHSWSNILISNKNDHFRPKNSNFIIVKLGDNHHFCSKIGTQWFLKIFENLITWQASKRQSEIEKNEEKNEEIKSHRINIDDITMIKVRLQVERDNLKGDAVELTRKLEDEHSLRNDLEDELQRLRKGKSFVKICLTWKFSGPLRPFGISIYHSLTQIKRLFKIPSHLFKNGV